MPLHPQGLVLTLPQMAEFQKVEFIVRFNIIVDDRLLSIGFLNSLITVI